MPYKPANIYRKLQYPSSWEQLAYGAWAKAQIQPHLDEWLPKLFGYHMLKLGGLSCEFSSQNCNIKHQILIDKHNPLRNMEADNYELPFISKAFDACLLANQLDYTEDPHRLLREIDRVMIDDGYLIITGVNPSSIMGIGRVFPWRKNSLPWNSRMYSPLRIQDWLHLLNYQIIESSYFGLFPTNNDWLSLNWLETCCFDLIPTLGSLYFIVARKRTYPLKPIKPFWKLKGSLSPAGVN